MRAFSIIPTRPPDIFSQFFHSGKAASPLTAISHAMHDIRYFIMAFRPPSADKMDFIAIHSREPKFQFLSPSLFLQSTMPMPAFEPFLRLSRGGCHTLCYLWGEQSLFCGAKFTLCTRVESVARAQAPVPATKPAPAEHEAQASIRAVPQTAERQEFSQRASSNICSSFLDDVTSTI